MICTATYENNTILNIRTTSKTNFTMSSKSNVEDKGGCILYDVSIPCETMTLDTLQFYL